MTASENEPDPLPDQGPGTDQHFFTEHDIVLGKGNGINCLPGNVKFRKIVTQYKPLYQQTPRNDKHKVAQQVIAELARLEPPGRFLEMKAGNKSFHQVPYKRAMEKTCQALREKKSGGHNEKDEGLFPHIFTKSALRDKMQQAPAVSGTSSMSASPMPGVDAALLLPEVGITKSAPSDTIDRVEDTIPDAAMDGLEFLKSDMDDDSLPTDPSQESNRQTISAVHSNDVLYGGRGRKYFHRRANQRFQDCIKTCRDDYRSSHSKKSVALKLIRDWKSQTPPGRFLEQTGQDWAEVPDEKVMEKTCQALRDLKRERPNRKKSGGQKEEQEVETANILTMLCMSR